MGIEISRTVCTLQSCYTIDRKNKVDYFWYFSGRRSEPAYIIPILRIYCTVFPFVLSTLVIDS